MAKGLTPQQRMFVRAYDGNGKKAALAAGCTTKSAEVTASRWLRLSKVRDAIHQREEYRDRGLVAKRQERQEFWSELMRSSTTKDSDRLRAAELLGKSEADFTEKHEVKGEFTLRDLILETKAAEKKLPTPPPPLGEPR